MSLSIMAYTIHTCVIQDPKIPIINSSLMKRIRLTNFEIWNEVIKDNEYTKENI